MITQINRLPPRLMWVCIASVVRVKVAANDSPACWATKVLPAAAAAKATVNQPYRFRAAVQALITMPPSAASGTRMTTACTTRGCRGRPRISIVEA